MTCPCLTLLLAQVDTLKKQVKQMEEELESMNQEKSIQVNNIYNTHKHTRALVALKLELMNQEKSIQVGLRL